MKIVIHDPKISRKDEKAILIFIIGILSSLCDETISLDDAEKAIFCPYYSNLLRKLGCASEIIDIIERGCELEDIRSLLPDHFERKVIDLNRHAHECLKTLSSNEEKERFFLVEISDRGTILLPQTRGQIFENGDSGG